MLNIHTTEQVITPPQSALHPPPFLNRLYICTFCRNIGNHWSMKPWSNVYFAYYTCIPSCRWNVMTTLQQCWGKSIKYRRRPTWQWLLSPETWKLGENSFPMKWTTFDFNHVNKKWIKSLVPLQLFILFIKPMNRIHRETFFTTMYLYVACFAVVVLSNVNATLSEILHGERTFSLHHLQMAINKRISSIIGSGIHGMIHFFSSVNI